MTQEEEYAGRVMAATYAQLVGEPFCLPMDRIAALTDWQIAAIYKHARKEETGEIEIPAAPPSDQDREAEFLAVCAALMMPAEETMRKLEEWRASRGRV